MSNIPDFKIGDFVRFNGSANPRFPRFYHGQILSVKEKTYIIVDNEWFAESEVTKTRVCAWDPTKDA